MSLRHLFATFALSACAASGQALITTIAGTGTCSYTGDGGPAAQATLCNPQGAITDGFGNIYFGDTGNFVVRKITPAGVISTIAGTGIRGTSDTGGAATSQNLGIFYQIGTDGLGDLCFGDDDLHKIRCVLLSNDSISSFGTGNPVSAGDGGAFYNASYNQPNGIAFVQRSQGNSITADIYISDSNDNIVRRIDGFTGLISTVVGPGTPGQLGDGGPGTSASLQAPGALTYFNGSIYIADTLDNRIRQLNLSTGIITTVAGNGVPYFAGDGGPATAAQLMSPGEVTFDSAGNMYITDRGNERIRKVDASGIINTVAGSGGEGWGPDNVPATQTSFGGLEGVFWNSPANQLLISDGSNRLRQVTYQSSTTTLTLTPSTVPVGAPVTMSATVSPSSATGMVNFYVNNVLFASVPLNAGQAATTWTASGSSPVLQAVYEGDTTYAPSLSQALGESVQLKPTSTALVTTPNPSAPNQTVTLTVTVTPAAATGTVTFYGNGAILGTPSLVNGTATVSTAFTNKGSVTVYAVYGGDNTYAGSYTSLLTQSVMVSTTTTMTSSQNPSIVGAAVSFVASVSPATAAGPVQFLDGGTVLGSVMLTSGSASFTTSTLTQGSHSITAVYNGDSGDTASTSAALSQTVNAKTATTTTITSTQNPAPVGASVTFLATVSPAAATGTVQFLDGATVLGTITLASGTASFSSSTLTQGTHSITAVYSGDANDTTSTSSALSQAVKLNSGVTLGSSLNPAVVGQTVTFTSNVNPAATGTIQFLDGTTALATVPVSSGVAAYSTSTLTAGPHAITAVYSGDANYIGATSTATTETVNAKTTTTTTVTATPNPAFVGAAVTFTASVNPAAATATVQILDGTTVLGTVTLAAGSASFVTSTLTQGTHSITAAYSGDTNNATSTSAVLSQTINAQSATVTTVTSTQNPIPVGAPVTFIATVTPATATGTVQFLDGAAVLGTAALANGSASFSATALAQGTHSITAAYSGDAGDTASTSAVLSQAVKLVTGLTLASSLNPSIVGQTVTFTSNVNPAATGTVQFLDGSTVLSTVPVSSGAAAFATSALAQGAHAISATYSGDTNYLSAGSAAQTQTVNAKTTTVSTVTSTPNPALVGAAVTFVATVSPATATGTVQFLDGSTVLGTGSLASGLASLASSTLAQGTHSITAVYSGDASDAGSTSAALSQVMKASAGMTAGVSPSPAVTGQTVRISASMNSAATGTVQFTDGGTVLATVTVTAGSASFSTSSLAQGSHTLGVAYSGDANYMSASTSFGETVLAATSVTLMTDTNLGPVGANVTFTAALTPNSATGTVQFFDGSTAIGTSAVVSGFARFSTTALTKGTHTMTAVYSGDSADAPATSPSIAEIVRGISTVSLTSNANPSVVGQSVTFTASVTPSTAINTVQFLDGSTVLSTVTLSSGTAVFATTQLAAGAHSITAAYSGDNTDAPATSAVLTQTVNLAPPSAPSNLTAAAAGSNQINLAWTASPTSGVTYDVYESTSSGFTPSSANRIASGVASTAYSATSLTASTTYYYRVSAVNGGGESAATSQASTTTSGTVACHVVYSVSNQWNVGFTGAVTIQNTGTTPIDPWTLTWAYPGSQKLTQSWNANYTQNGPSVTLTNMSYNARISAGATLNGVGFNGSYSGSNPAPTAFYVNGTLCH